jgi:hypothetical protein
MHNDYLAQQKFLEGLKQPQGQVPPQQGTPPVGNAPRQPVPAAGQPQASITSPQVFGSPTVLAQGGFQSPQGMGVPVGQSAYQPTGDYTSPEVFGAANVLAQPAGQTQSTQTAPAAVPQGGARKWTSNDGKYSRQGEFQGFAPGLSQSGSPIVMIKKSDNQETITVPLDRLSNEDRMFLSRDTQYSLQNPQMSAGQAYFDPNNPVYAEMRAADQNIVNPQRQTFGEPGGSRGLGQINYGQGPSGQNVYADIVPGGTMPVTRPRAATPEEQAYDEKQSQKYKEWRAKQGAAPKAETPSLTTLLSKMTPSQRRDYTKWLQADPNRYANRNAIASQQLQQWENNVASGNLPTYPGSQKSAQGQPAAGKPAAKVDRSSPEVKAALKVASDSNATDEQKRAAAKTLDAAGFTGEEVLEATTKGATSPTTANQPAPTAAASKSREPSERPLRDDVQKAYEIIKGNRSHDRAGNKYLEFANAEKTLKAEGWTDQDISDLRRGKSKKKLPERPNPQQIADMQTRLQSGNVSDAEREVIEDVLKAEGVSLDASPASTPSQPAIPSRSLTSPPGGETTTQSDLLSEQPEYEPPQLAETRIWTNVEGKKLEGIVVEGSIEAAANQPEGQRVITIKRSDGKFFNIPIDQLSEEDIAYIDAKYRMKNPPSSIVGEDGEDFFSRFKKGKAYKYEKPKQTDRKYNTGEKPGPRSKQYQDPGPFNDSIPAEFWNPKPPSEAYRQRMG